MGCILTQPDPEISSGNIGTWKQLDAAEFAFLGWVSRMREIQDPVRGISPWRSLRTNIQIYKILITLLPIFLKTL
jgi:hypothetical protein